MSPRFPQEVFDYIIDYAKDHVADPQALLRTFSVVCTRWAARCRRHRFDIIFICNPRQLARWCEAIPPTIDGPSNYVTRLLIQSEGLPLVDEPIPLDPYLPHFSVLTRVTRLSLWSHRGRAHLDMIFQCFAAFRNNLNSLDLSENAFGFEEMSRIVEFFPNLEVLQVVIPRLDPADKDRQFPPLRRASFPRLKKLNLHLFSMHPALEDNIVAGFAEASVNLETIFITGKVHNPGLIQKLLDSSAQSLTYLRLIPMDVDLSACQNLEDIDIIDALYTCIWFHNLFDTLNKPQLEHVLSTIKSPVLSTISVRTHRHPGSDEWEEEKIPITRNDWTVVDALLCDMVSHIRERVKDPSWTFAMRITRFKWADDEYPPEMKEFLPDFRAIGGVVIFTSDR